MSESIVVFLCRCADNVSATVDLEAVAERAAALPGVGSVGTHELLCGPDGKAFVAEELRRRGATRAVVAACSIREHEPTFQGCMVAAGLSPYLLAMTNIREHCAWATPEREAATRKAAAMVVAAVERVRHLEPLEAESVSVNPDVLVIGGGVAGMEAALLAAQAGRKVTLVERSPSIGGRAAAFEDVAPSLECAPCMLAPRLSAVASAPEIELMTCAEVVEVKGYLGAFRATVEKRARWIDPAACLACDECYPACPVEVPSELDLGMRTRKAIYKAFPGAVPNIVAIDREACLRSKGEECTACRDACPLEAVVYDQQDERVEVEAGALVVATGFSPHEPEALARLGHGALPDVVTLPELERLLASDGPTNGRPTKADGEHPRRIAVLHCVGRKELGYCSGLCCATALKTSLLANKHGGAAEVVHVHDDLVLRGPEDWALRARAVDKGGARLVRVPDVEAVRLEKAEGGGYRLLLPEGSPEAAVEADMVVLATGLAPSPTTRAIAEALELRAGPGGFLEPDHHFLRPAQSSLEGVSMAGCVAGPRNVAESVAHAQAAAASTLARIQPGRTMALEPVRAAIDDDRCCGCLVCVAVCPYKANEVDEASGRPRTSAVLCKGCGTCVAACPSGAAAARHFGDGAILAEIKGVLSVDA